MATLASLTGDYSDAAWSKGLGYAAHGTDPTRLVITITGSLNLCDTPANYDLTASSFTWKWERLPFSGTAGGPSSAISMEWRDNGSAGTGYRLLRSASTGVWQFQKGGTIVGSTWTDVNARANPYCRIREASGTTFFEYSADGSSWSQPTSNQSTANYATGGGITTLKPRWQPSAVADAGLCWVQQTNGASAPSSITDDPTIVIVDQTVTAAAAALNTSPAVPSSATGDLSLLIIAGKLSTGTTATSSTPSGWTIIGAISQSGTAATAANDTGDTAVVMYYRTDTGYSAPTISTTNFNSMGSGIVVFRSSVVGAGGSWDVSQTTTGSDTSSGANISITGAGGIDVAAGDLVLAAFGCSGDVGTTSAYTIGGMSGATLLSGATETPIKRDVTTGNDSRIIATYIPVSSGSSSSAPTYAITNSSSTTGHARFLRIRDVPGLTTVTDSQAATWNVIGTVTDSQTATWNVTTTVADSSTSEWNVATLANSKTETLTPEFSDTGIWDSTDGATAGSNDTLNLPLSSAASKSLTINDYDLKSSTFAFRIDQLHTQTSNDVQTSVLARVNGSNANMLRFLITSTTTTVYMRYTVASSTTNLANYTWSSSRPWLRFRESSGTVYWEDSADGTSWTQQASWVHGDAIDLTDLEMGFQAIDGLDNPSSGTTIISHVNTTIVPDSQAGTWNVAQAVTDSADSTWNVAAEVTDSNTSTWNAAATVTDSNTSTWNVTTVVADSQEATWNVAAAITDSSTSTWNVAAAITDSSTSTWNVAAAVTDSNTSTWNVVAAITDSSTSTWNVASAVTDSTTQTWNVIGRVEDSSTSTWNVVAAVTDSSTSTWNVAFAVTDSNTSTWNDTTTADDSQTATWNVTTTVADSQIATWNVTTTADDSQTGTWNVLAAVTDSATGTWNVAAEVTDSTTQTWNVIGPIADSQAATWNVAAAVTDSNTSTWNVTTTVADSCTAEWNVAAEVAVTDSQECTWNVAQTVTDSSTSTWNCGGVVTDSTTATWNVESAVTDSNTSTWNVRSVIDDSSISTWNVLAVITDSFTGTWNCGGRIEDSVTATYNVAAVLSDSNTSTWHVTTTIADSQTVTYNVLTSLDDSASATWNVIGRVTDSQVGTWHVQQTITDSQIYTYYVLETLTDSIESTFFVLESLEDAFTGEWDVRADVSDSSTSTWQVLPFIATAGWDMTAYVGNGDGDVGMARPSGSVHVDKRSGTLVTAAPGGDVHIWRQT